MQDFITHGKKLTEKKKISFQGLKTIIKAEGKIIFSKSGKMILEIAMIMFFVHFTF